MLEKPCHRFFLLSAVVAAAIFAFDLLLPLGIAGGVPYVALVLVGLWAVGARPIIILACVGTILTVAGYFFSPVGGIWWVVLANRGLAIFAIWTTAILVAHRMRARAALDMAQAELEQRVLQRTAELKESEARYRALTEGSLQGIGIIQDQCVGFANGAFAEMLGYQPEEILHRPTFDLVMPEYQALVVERRDQRLRGEPQPAKYDLQLRHRDGHGVWVAMLVQSVQWYGRTAAQVSIVNISKRKEAEAALLAAKDDAEHANRAKTEFLAHFSHELRTPLNAIIGFSEIMQGEIFGPMGDKRYGEYAGDIHRSGKHLLALISDILDLSRIEAGEFERDEQVFNAGTATEECVRLLCGRADEKGVTIELRLPEMELWLNADERQFRQILLNLLSNAVKFTRRNTVVTVAAETSDGGAMCFRVGDCGEGMAADDIVRVQEPFIRLAGAQTSSEEGTGLGLAITKRLVESHAGSLCLRSKVGVGTTATVSFPPDRFIGKNPKSFSELTSDQNIPELL
ncbi:MAG: PAS domain S-box protein [Alphaproteobacteria bacterium]|nr:PAS domain S-box protein [Alphaproteobacteria bacterium]